MIQNYITKKFEIDYENLNKGGLFGKGVNTETTDATIKIDTPNELSQMAQTPEIPKKVEEIKSETKTDLDGLDVFERLKRL